MPLITPLPLKPLLQLLGIESTCTQNDIKKAYRKLALKLHPDKCTEEGAEEAFKKLNGAFR